MFQCMYVKRNLQEEMEERVERFFEYLNMEMEIVSSHMYYDCFTAFLSQIWVLTIRVCRIPTNSLYYIREFTGCAPSLLPPCKTFEDILLPVNKEEDKYHSNRATIAEVIGIILSVSSPSFF